MGMGERRQAGWLQLNIEVVMMGQLAWLDAKCVFAMGSTAAAVGLAGGGTVGETSSNCIVTQVTWLP